MKNMIKDMMEATAKTFISFSFIACLIGAILLTVFPQFWLGLYILCFAQVWMVCDIHDTWAQHKRWKQQREQEQQTVSHS